MDLLYELASPVLLMALCRCGLHGCVLVPASSAGDNFAYLIIDRSSKEAALVDPADPQEVMRVVRQMQCTLTTILTTHRHHDHAGGNRWLRARFPNLRVVGGVGEVREARHCLLVLLRACVHELCVIVIVVVGICGGHQGAC